MTNIFSQKLCAKNPLWVLQAPIANRSLTAVEVWSLVWSLWKPESCHLSHDGGYRLGPFLWLVQCNQQCNTLSTMQSPVELQTNLREVLQSLALSHLRHYQDTMLNWRRCEIGTPTPVIVKLPYSRRLVWSCSSAVAHTQHKAVCCRPVSSSSPGDN